MSVLGSGVPGTPMGEMTVLPTYRMLVAGPDRDKLESMLHLKGFEEIKVREVESVAAGIRKVLFTNREMRLRVENAGLNSIGSDMELVEAWLTCEPQVLSFLYWPCGRLMTGYGDLIENGGLFEKAVEHVLNRADDPWLQITAGRFGAIAST